MLTVGVAKPYTGLRAVSATHGVAVVAPPQRTQTLSVSSGGGYGAERNTYSPQAAGSFGSTYNPQGGAVNPYNYGSVGAPAGGGATGTGTGTGNGTGDTEEAAAAQRAAQAAALKSSITGLIGNIKGVYDALYGDVVNVARDRAHQVNEQYGEDVKTLTDQFNGQFPLIGQGHAARGTYDSSYRINNEKTAQDAFGNSTNTLARGRRQDQAKIGQFVRTQRAGFDEQKGGLDAVLAHIAESDNPDELTTLRNTLDERLRSVQAKRAGLGTENSYLQSLDKVVPKTDRVTGLKTQLNNVLNSEVPAPIKLAIAGQLANQSGLNGTDTKKLLDEFQAQVGISDKDQVPA